MRYTRHMLEDISRIQGGKLKLFGIVNELGLRVADGASSADVINSILEWQQQNDRAAPESGQARQPRPQYDVLAAVRERLQADLAGVRGLRAPAVVDQIARAVLATVWANPPDWLVAILRDVEQSKQYYNDAMRDYHYGQVPEAVRKAAGVS